MFGKVWWLNFNKEAASPSALAACLVLLCSEFGNLLHTPSCAGEESTFKKLQAVNARGTLRGTASVQTAKSSRNYFTL